MALPGFGNKLSPSIAFEPPGTPATLRAQSHLLAARDRADGSFVAGLCNTYVTRVPEVGAWLFGGASDRPPVGKLTDVGFVYRVAYDDQPESALALHGECLMSQVILGPFVLGTVLDARESHPFVPLGAAVCDISLNEKCLRRRFAVDLSAACLDYVEAAFMADGRVLVHERRIVLTETGQFFHEAIRWYNSAGPIAEPPPWSVCLAQLLMRSWERSEVCLDCNPGGDPVRQPCRHRIAAVRGLPMITFDQWCATAQMLSLEGISSIELQQYAAANLASLAEEPARANSVSAETGVVATLPSVGYRYSCHRSDDALSFFSNALRRSILGGGDQPCTDSLRLGTPIYQATVAIANETAALEGAANKEEYETRRRSQAFRLVSKLSRAIERLPPGFVTIGPPRDTTSLDGSVPTEVDLGEGNTEPDTPSGASSSSGAISDSVSINIDAARDLGGSYFGSDVLTIDAAAAATGRTHNQPRRSTAVMPHPGLIGASSLVDHPTAVGAPPKSWNMEEPGITVVAEDGEDLATPSPALPLNSAELELVRVEQAHSGSTVSVEAGTQRPTHHRGPVAADVRVTAKRAGPLTGRVTRVHSDRPLERGTNAKAFSNLALRPLVDAEPWLAEVGPSTGSSSKSGSSASLEHSINVEGQSKVGPTRLVGKPVVLPPTQPTGRISSSEELLAAVGALPSASFTATPRPAFATKAAASSQPAPDRQADAPPRRAKVHPCTLCDASFASRSDATRHIVTVHERRRQWPCEYPGCQFTGLQKGHLTTHVAAVHHTERPYVCTECLVPGRPPFRSISRSAVERHVRRVHRGIRPYGCPSCRHAFASRSDLRRHCLRQHGAASLERDGGGGSATHAEQILRTEERPGGEDTAGATATLSGPFGPP